MNNRIKSPSFSHGFSLVEALIVISVLGIVAAIAIPSVGNFRQSANNVKLENDLKVLNSAAQTYLASGGKLSSSDDVASVIAKTKASLTEAERKTHVGFSGSMVDERLEPVWLSEKEVNSGVNRIVWDKAEMRFKMTNEKVAGVKEFKLVTVEKGFARSSDSAGNKAAPARESTVEYASKTNWVWDFEEAAVDSRDGVTVVATSPPVASTPPVITPPAPVVLDPPTFSIASGTFPLDSFEKNLVLANPNPGNAGVIAYRKNGGNWMDYNPGTVLKVSPNDSFSAFVVSSDRQRFLDSSLNSEQYFALAEQLNLQLSSTSRTVNYFDLIDRRFALNLKVTNADTIPPSIRRDGIFATFWSAAPNRASVPGNRSLAGAYTSNYEGHAVGLSPDAWEDNDVLRLNAFAESADESVLKSSNEPQLEISIEPLQLPAPGITLDDRGDGSFLVTMEHGGRIPEGTVLAYNSAGDPPSFNSEGKVVNGQTYSGPFVWTPTLEEEDEPSSGGSVDIGRGENDIPISSVTLKTGGKKIVQNQSANFEVLDNPGFDGIRGAEVYDNSSSAITLESITIEANGKTIVADKVNVLEVKVSNFNFHDSVPNGTVSVINGGEYKGNIGKLKGTSKDRREFQNEIAASLSSKNFRHYINYASNKSEIKKTDHDFDVSFSPLTNDDFLVVAERFGNSTFDLRPLDASGNEIPGGKRLVFREYSWNTGYAPSDVGGQPFFLSVISIKKFGVDTNLNTISGFRVNNDGGADFKFLTISDKSFEDREYKYSGLFQARAFPPKELSKWFEPSDLASREVEGTTTRD